MFGQKGTFALLDSTAFPDVQPNRTNETHLQGLNITPIVSDRTNPNLITLSSDSDQSPEVPMRSDKQGEDLSKQLNIDTVELTSSDIDSLLNRFKSILKKSAKNDIFDNLSPPKEPKANVEELATDFTLSSVPTSSNVSLPSHSTFPSEDNNSHYQYNDPISFSCTLLPETTNSDKAMETHLSHSREKREEGLFSSKTNVNKSQNLIIDADKALMEADQILERLEMLRRKSKSNNSQVESSNVLVSKNLSKEKTNSIESPHHDKTVVIDKTNNKSKQAPLTTTIEQQPEMMNFDNDSDSATEYYGPPPLMESNRSFMNQTYNSHIFTESKKRNLNSPIHPQPKQTAQQSKEKEGHDHDLPPLVSPPLVSLHHNNRSISNEEEMICLDQMERGRNDLKRLHRELLRFEREYIAQHEKRKAKKKHSAALPLKHSAKSAKSSKPTTSHSHSRAKHSQESLHRPTAAKAVVKEDKRPQAMERTDGHSAPTDSINRRKSSSATTSTTTGRSSPSLQSRNTDSVDQHKQNFHRNARRVRFDHEHLAHRIELISANPTTATAPTASDYQVERKVRCACCERHSTMNKTDHNRHLDCLQLERVRLDDDDHSDGGSRHRCKTAKTRMANERKDAHLNMDKSIQTSFIISREDSMRSKSVNEARYHHTGANRGSLPRTPPTNVDNSPSNRSLVYFVSLEGNEPKKKSIAINSQQPPQSTATIRSNRGKSQQQQSEMIESHRMEPMPIMRMPVAAHTLQDAFDRNCNQFKLRSLMRVRKIKDNEDLRKQTADQRREEITQTYLMKKKFDDDRRHNDMKVTDNNSNNNNNNNHRHQHPPLNATRPAVNKKTIKVANHNPNDGYPRALPLITRRVFTHKEMRAQTEKVYRKLPEVKAQSVNVRREDDARRRRMMADIFKQRLKENAVKGKLNWPITSQAITA